MSQAREVAGQTTEAANLGGLRQDQMASRCLTVTTISGVVISWSEPPKRKEMSSILIQLVVVIAGLAIVAVGFGSAGRLKPGMVLIGIGLVAPVVLTIVRSFAP